MLTNTLTAHISLKQKILNQIESKLKTEWIAEYLKYSLYTLKILISFISKIIKYSNTNTYNRTTQKWITLLLFIRDI